MQPAFADETPLDPFNLWKGADFKVKIRKVDGYWNYDKSEFAAPATLAKLDDDELEKIWKQSYSLAEFEAAKNFKSYEQLKARLSLVLGKAPQRTAPVVDESEEEVAPANWGKEVTDFKAKAVAAAPASGEEDTLSYFASLAEED